MLSVKRRLYPRAPINANFDKCRPIPEKLWHYTSLAGFQGIVTTRKIFATDTRFLNDREEFLHSYKIATEVAEANPELVPLICL